MDILALFNVGSNLMFSLGILFILIFTIFYIRQRLSDYDNKINSMFQLVSKMANEIRNLKTPLPPIYENEELPNYKTDDLKVVSVNINDEYNEEDEDIIEYNKEESNENDEEYENSVQSDDLVNKDDFEDNHDMTTHIDDNSILTSNLQKELESSMEYDLIEEGEEVEEEEVEEVEEGEELEEGEEG